MPPSSEVFLYPLRHFQTYCLYVPMSLCPYVLMSLCLYVPMSLCLYDPMTLCSYVPMSLCPYVRLRFPVNFKIALATFIRNNIKLSKNLNPSANFISTKRKEILILNQFNLMFVYLGEKLFYLSYLFTKIKN